jgi:hypothetical protein
MKKILLPLLLLLNTAAFSQVTADPALSPIIIKTVSNTTINQFQLPKDGVTSLKIPIYNLNFSNPLPAGTCKIKINLGSKLILDPQFALASVNTSNYFSWSAIASGGQVQITGDLIAQLPSNFSDTASFNVMGNILGNSTITTNFLVTNHNTAITLSDENGSNNTSSLPYTIIPSIIVPVTFTNITATQKDCSFMVDFKIENQINVDRYDIELSSDLNSFEKMGSLAASATNNYSYRFIVPEKYQVPVCLVRIKAIDKDGKFLYSEIKKLSGVCNIKSTVLVYPNPIPVNTKSIFIENSNALFNGSYSIYLMDYTGKKIQQKEITLLNTSKFSYQINDIASGQYFIRLVKIGTEDILTFKIIKL